MVIGSAYRRLRRATLLALAWTLTALPAFAHTEVGVAGGLISGLLHPVFGPDHLVAMLAVGLWGAILGPPLIWVLPITFPLIMAVGAVAAVVGVPLPGVEIGVALSALLLGLMVLTAARPPRWLAIAMIAFFAIFHGHAHGGELPEAANPLAYGIGFVASTGFIHLCGILIGTLITKLPSVGLNVVRACGGVVAAAGCWFLLDQLGGAS